MTKFRHELSGVDGWSREIMPVPTGYKLACCDCGLVHDTEFSVVKVLGVAGNGDTITRKVSPDKFRVIFKVRRNERSTAALRREEKKRKARGS